MPVFWRRTLIAYARPAPWDPLSAQRGKLGKALSAGNGRVNDFWTSSTSASANNPRPVRVTWSPSWTRTRSRPQLGESFFNTYPARSADLSSRERAPANPVIRAVQSSRLFTPTSRTACAPDGTPSALAIRWIASRGVPIPTSTSGHTGTHSTKRPKVETRNGSRLWPPS